MKGAWRRVWMTRPRTTGATLIGFAALLASLTSFTNGFALDDIPVIQTRARLHTLADPLQLLTTAYWQLPPNDTLWRPLGLWGFAVQWALGGGAPWVFHATSIALYLACALAVFALAWALLPPAGALAAGLVFAVHPVHVESVGNIVGQLELWVTLAVVLASLLYLRARRAGALSATTITALIACYALGLGMKEHAVLLPAFLIALEWTVLRETPEISARARVRVRILFALLGALAVLWLAVRSGIVGGLAGDHPHVALQGLNVIQRGGVMLGLLPEIVRLLVWPVRLYADYSPQYVTIHIKPNPAHLLGIAMLTAYAGALWWTSRRNRSLALGLLWVPLAMALVANVVVPTGILLAERTLFLATVGVALVGGALVAQASVRLSSAAPVFRTLALAAGGSLVVLGIAHSAERQRVWKDNPSLVTSLIIDAPTNFRGHYWLGDHLLGQGRMVEGEQMMRRAMRLWPAHDGPPLGLALRYQQHGMCAPALPLYERVLRLSPRKPVPHVGYASCLLTIGRLRDARRAALIGLETGQSTTTFRSLLLQVDSALAAADSADGNNWWVRRQRFY